MESNDQLREINTKNFDGIIKIANFDINNILIDEKPYRNILVYNISYKSLIDSKPLRIRFDKTDGFIRVYDGTRYLVFCKSEKDDYIYNRIRYFIRYFTDIISHNYANIKVDRTILYL